MSAMSEEQTLAVLLATHPDVAAGDVDLMFDN
jgi:hypothetical protein